MKKKLKAFTLIEVIVAMAILAIMMSIIVMLVSSTARLVNTSNEVNVEVDKQIESYEAENPMQDNTEKGKITFIVPSMTLEGNKTLPQNSVTVDVDVTKIDKKSDADAPNMYFFKIEEKKDNTP